MSDKSTGVSDAQNANVSDDGEEKVTESVSVEAHKRLLAQRKADRDKARALEEERNTLKAQLEAKDAETLAEQSRYKELYEAEKKKREESDGKLADMSRAQVESAKKAALREALGISKQEYLKFADLSSIQMNDDGTPDSDSLKAVANKFRESYPELLPVKASGTLPNNAPGNGGAPKPPKSYAEMSAEELRAAYLKQRMSTAK